MLSNCTLSRGQEYGKNSITPKIKRFHLFNVFIAFIFNLSQVFSYRFPTFSAFAHSDFHEFFVISFLFVASIFDKNIYYFLLW